MLVAVTVFLSPTCSREPFPGMDSRTKYPDQEGGAMKVGSKSDNIKRKNTVKTLAAFVVLVCKSTEFLPRFYTVSEERRGQYSRPMPCGYPGAGGERMRVN